MPTPLLRGTDLSAAEARRALDSRDISAVELAEAHLERIDQFDAELGVYLHVMREAALDQAAAADRRLAAGDALPLTGIPIALKDVLCTIDAPTTAGSRILEGFHHLTTRPSCGAFASKGRCFSGKPTRTSSRWAHRMKIRLSNR